MVKTRVHPWPETPYAISTTAGGIDDGWDRFLEAHPWGRHEQTSRWGQLKQRQGWEALRAVARREGETVGGFQLLHRRRAPLVRIGYVSHGPVIAPDQPGLAPLLAEAVIAASRRLRLRALALQTPREHDPLTREFEQRGFFPDRLNRIIDTTAELDLTRDEAQLLAGMHRFRRRHIRRSANGPLEIAEGTRCDLGVFFNLMEATCRRQGVSPNPPDLGTLQELWDLYAGCGWLRLFLVQLDGQAVCAALAIPFGDRFWFWKIGWSGNHAELSPNDHLHWACIRWAREHGYRRFDFVGIDRHMRTIADDAGPVAPELAKSPSFYKLGFGPTMVDLQPPLIWFRPAPLNLAYRCYAVRRPFRHRTGSSAAPNNPPG